MTPSPTLLSGANAAFVEALYEEYLADPQSVDANWRSYFDELRAGARDVAHSGVQQAFYALGQQHPARRLSAPSALQHRCGKASCSGAQLAASALINAYRVYGHIAAKTNPLSLRRNPVIPELTPEYYHLSAQDLQETISEGVHEGKLGDILEQLKQIYCGTIGFEFSYLPATEREWFQQRIEKGHGQGRYSHSPEEKRRILEKLTAAEGLERYLHVKYVGQKRFSLEGSESFIPLLDRIINRAGALGVKETIIGMAHRGRLNVLINTMGKSPSDLYGEFEGRRKISDDPEVSGDVKYHMGDSSDVNTPGGLMHLSLAYNPSHLEYVAPVVHGSVRARQDRRGDTERHQVLPITVHGDAAVIGQGVVPETLNLSRLRGFATGGAIRIVINNQIGFTVSDPRDTRSSRYCTDIAKIGLAPVMHVNGDDPEAVAFAGDLALEYRQQFSKDVFIDLISFRRHGHNEADDPTMTQPMMYREVKAHPGTRALYAQKLEQSGVLKAGEADALVKGYEAQLDKGDSVVSELVLGADQNVVWDGYNEVDWNAPTPTGVSAEKLQDLGTRMSEVPEGFKLHRVVGKVMESRKAMARGEQLLDWGMGEMLAYATLLDEGYRVRLVGEDSGRGTFVHRHAVLHNQDATDPTNEDYLSLAHLREGQGQVEVIDSTLSEEAVMAYEYGYSTSEPRGLVAWEAQFGDFANGAQVIIDQFIASGETKWQRHSGLTLLLPHGFEGAGPEHSSARLERYLQLCAQHNMVVVVPSSAAQIFHLLRRQVLRRFRRPLIVMTPKSLLRNKYAMSPLSDLTSGQFQELIGDDSVQKARRVVLSSGKLHWEMFEARDADKEGYKGVALVRIEQLYPFPAEALRAELARHEGAEVVWAQEEPENQGAWLMIREDLEQCLQPGQKLLRATRARAASTATGYAKVHAVEQAAVIAAALGEKIKAEVVADQLEVAEEAKQQG